MSEVVRQENEDNYWVLMDARRRQEKTTSSLTPAELQLIITSGERDPSLWRKLPIVRELEKALSGKEVENMTLKESGWFNENVVSQYGGFAKFTQKIAVGVDVLAKAAINRAVVLGRGMDGAGRLVNKRQGPSIFIVGAVIILIIFSAAVAWNLATDPHLFAGFVASSFYGFPTPMLTFVLIILAFYMAYRITHKPASTPA